MKKIIAVVCLLALLTVSLCGCGHTCEHCGESAMTLNLVGDDANGIYVCNTCIEKMTMGKISFTFTCESCNQQILGKKNTTTVGTETKIVCNSCCSK